jgi:hypothetical protein
MWILAPCGFFSIVQKPGDKFLTVRARVASDLENLRTRFLPSLSKTIKGGGTDYPYRATISHSEFAAGLAKMGQHIDYSNFKDEVKKEMGRHRAEVFSKVWQTLLELEENNG